MAWSWAIDPPKKDPDAVQVKCNCERHWWMLYTCCEIFGRFVNVTRFFATLSDIDSFCGGGCGCGGATSIVAIASAVRMLPSKRIICKWHIENLKLAMNFTQTQHTPFLSSNSVMDHQHRIPLSFTWIAWNYHLELARYLYLNRLECSVHVNSAVWTWILVEKAEADEMETKWKMLPISIPRFSLRIYCFGHRKWIEIFMMFVGTTILMTLINFLNVPAMECSVWFSLTY